MIIGFPHKPPGKGGPGSFQKNFEESIRILGWEIVFPENQIIPDIVIVIGGTKRIAWLYKLKRNGVSIIHRLDGMNWMHRKKHFAMKNWINAELSNLILQFIRSFLATHIVYQSNFVKQWWDKNGWKTHAKNIVINNGVDLNKFYPKENQKSDGISLLCVEGNIDYSPYAIELLNDLQEKLIKNSEYKSLILYGGFQDSRNKTRLSSEIDYRGIISHKDVSKVYTNAIYLSLDVNAACPNSVIEALASGIPVIGYDTGALKELISEEAGIVVSFGGDPWNLDFPGLDELISAAKRVFLEWNRYSNGARNLAKERYDIKKVQERYIEFIIKDV